MPKQTAPKSAAMPTERQSQNVLRKTTTAVADDAQLRHIRALLAKAHNPLTGDKGISFEHLRQMATVDALRASDDALDELFKGHDAFDMTTGEASAWAIDISQIVNVSVEECFTPRLHHLSELQVVQGEIALRFQRAIGEHSKVLDAPVTIASTTLPLQNPVKLHADHVPVNVGAFDDMIALRGISMPIDDALEIFDHALSIMPDNYKTPRSITPRILQMMHGFDRLALRDGEKETFTVNEIADVFCVTRTRISDIIKHAHSVIRYHVARDSSDVDRHRLTNRRAPRTALSAPITEETPFTANDAIRIMLAPDFLGAAQERAQDLLDEAKLLRREHKKALVEQARALKKWDKNRNAETNAALEDAYERADILHHHIITLIKDLEKFRVLQPRAGTAAAKLEIGR